MQYAAKEVCRLMSSPTERSWERLKRIGRYLKSKPRLVWTFQWQQAQTTLDVYSDANWAGCKRSRKSTSGGVAMLGAHVIKTWSKTQAVIAKSSAESELYGIVRAATEGMGIASLMFDFGMTEADVRLHVDANAAMGIIQRRGLGKVRHVEVDLLWLQEQQARRLLPLKKVLGTKNPGDLMTKHLSAAIIEFYIEMMGMRHETGRADIAQQLHGISNQHKSLRKKKSNRQRRTKPPQTADAWAVRGDDETWVRTHNVPRQSLCTPMKIPGGPTASSCLEARRVTRGINVGDTKPWVIVDNWTDAKCAHRLLQKSWTGTTTFHNAPGGGAQRRDDDYNYDNDSDDSDSDDGISDAEKNTDSENKTYPKSSTQHFDISQMANANIKGVNGFKIEPNDEKTGGTPLPGGGLEVERSLHSLSPVYAIQVSQTAQGLRGKEQRDWQDHLNLRRSFPAAEVCYRQQPVWGSWRGGVFDSPPRAITFRFNACVAGLGDACGLGYGRFIRGCFGSSH